MTIAPESTGRPYESFGTNVKGAVASGTTVRAPWIVSSRPDEAFTYRTALTVNVRGERLVWPLPVEVRRTTNYVSVAELDSGIHGVGASLEEATKDFYAALLEFRDTLARSTNLTPHLRHLLAFTASLA